MAEPGESPADGTPDPYVNIRDADVLGPIIGARVVDVTQHDKEEFDEDRTSMIYLHFDNGIVLAVPIGDLGFTIMNAPDGEET